MRALKIAPEPHGTTHTGVTMDAVRVVTNAAATASDGVAQSESERAEKRAHGGRR